MEREGEGIGRGWEGEGMGKGGEGRNRSSIRNPRRLSSLRSFMTIPNHSSNRVKHLHLLENGGSIVGNCDVTLLALNLVKMEEYN